MPDPNVLQSIISGSLAPSMPTATSDWDPNLSKRIDPNVIAQMAAAPAGTDFTKMGIQADIPSGGPLGTLLQALHLRASTRPVSPAEVALGKIAQTQWLQEQSAQRAANVGPAVSAGVYFGGPTARGVGGYIDPALGAAFPAGIPGKGQLAAQEEQSKAMLAQAKAFGAYAKAQTDQDKNAIMLQAVQAREENLQGMLQLKRDEDAVRAQAEQLKAVSQEMMPFNTVLKTKMAGIERDRQKLDEYEYGPNAMFITPAAKQSIQAQRDILQAAEDSLMNVSGMDPKQIKEFLKTYKTPKITTPAPAGAGGRPPDVTPEGEFD